MQDDGYYWSVQMEEQFNDIFKENVNVSTKETNASKDRATEHEAIKIRAQ